MIDFIYDTGRKTNLIAVGGIAGRCGRNNLALGQLAGNRLGNRPGRIRGSGHAHCAIDIGTAGERVPDRAADAGGSAAEGLDFGGMIVRLVFEEKEPGLFPAVYLDVHLHRTGVDLL